MLPFEQIRPAKGARTSQQNFALGTIYYEPNDPPDKSRDPEEQVEIGRLIYVKSSMPMSGIDPGRLGNGLPDDVWQYFEENERFPHQSTADQWFDERQFESYRALGEFLGDTAAAQIRGHVLSSLEAS